MSKEELLEKIPKSHEFLLNSKSIKMLGRNADEEWREVEVLFKGVYGGYAIKSSKKLDPNPDYCEFVKPLPKIKKVPTTPEDKRKQVNDWLKALIEEGKIDPTDIVDVGDMSNYNDVGWVITGCVLKIKGYSLKVADEKEVEVEE